MSGRRSRIRVTCRSVIPPEAGTTAAPSSIAPWWMPRPPVNRPYPYALCTMLRLVAPAGSARAMERDHLRLINRQHPQRIRVPHVVLDRRREVRQIVEGDVTTPGDADGFEPAALYPAAPAPAGPAPAP